MFPAIICYRYLFYLICLPVLLLLPSDTYRLFYLHGISVLLILYVEFEVKFYILLAMFHSAIHNLWPFLTNNGYDRMGTSVYDVMCHFMMMLICYKKIFNLPTHVVSKRFHFLTFCFLIGSVVNCFCSYAITDSDNYVTHSLFEYTTIFQAISTGYWLATMFWFGCYHQKSFELHWMIWISLMSMNWLFYRLNEQLVGISTQYRYIEAVFIIGTWPLILK